MIHYALGTSVFVLHGSEAFIVFRGFAFLAANIQSCGKELLMLSCASVLFKLVILNYILKRCLINKVLE